MNVTFAPDTCGAVRAQLGDVLEVGPCAQKPAPRRPGLQPKPEPEPEPPVPGRGRHFPSHAR
mgnify:CR=1 FL=1